MTTTTGIIIALILCLIGTGGYAYGQHQKVRVERAINAPLKQRIDELVKLAESHRVAREECSLEMRRVDDANERALAEAEKKVQAAERAAEEYQKRLTNPSADCAPLLTQKICPALQDY